MSSQANFIKSLRNGYWTLVDALQKKFKGNRNESKVKVETSWKEDGFGFPLKLVEMALELATIGLRLQKWQITIV